MKTQKFIISTTTPPCTYATDDVQKLEEDYGRENLIKITDEEFDLIQTVASEEVKGLIENIIDRHQKQLEKVA